MAALRNPNGSIAKFLVNDGEGNEALGHFEFIIVPSFEPGARIGDMTFVVDERTKSAKPIQSPAELVQQARLGGVI